MSYCRSTTTSHHFKTLQLDIRANIIYLLFWHWMYRCVKNVLLCCIGCISSSCGTILRSLLLDRGKECGQLSSLESVTTGQASFPDIGSSICLLDLGCIQLILFLLLRAGASPLLRAHWRHPVVVLSLSSLTTASGWPDRRLDSHFLSVIEASTITVLALVDY